MKYQDRVEVNAGSTLKRGPIRFSYLVRPFNEILIPSNMNERPSRLTRKRKNIVVSGAPILSPHEHQYVQEQEQQDEIDGKGGQDQVSGGFGPG